MKRRVLSTIIALLLVAALLPMSVLAASYTDTDGHWAESSIERWSDAGVVQGTGDAFAPDSDLTCAQLVTILAKLLRLPAADDAGFSDNLADAWYYDAINRCAAAGILNGYADGTVRPNETISRARAMVMLARALGIEPAGTSVLNGYADAANVPDWARGYVAALLRADIVSGVSGSRLAALANITRAQFVTILDRAIAIYADEDGATVKADDVDGIIVVVAEDVQIKDAPAGTKVVAAASAKSLKVNGKSVDANDIHIVPETVERPKSVGHAHSHSYDEATHKCSCGAFDPAVVATVNDSVGYLTFADAVANTADGDTLTVIKDAETKNIADTFAARIVVNKKITLNLNAKIISPDNMGNNNTNFTALIIAADTVINANENGGIDTGINGGYAINVLGGAKLTINGGTYYGGGTAVQVQKGELTINGGDYAVEPYSNPVYGYKFLLNCIDAALKDGTAKITVTGGTFANYDPSDSASENPHGNFVAAGYQATEESGVWTVSERAGNYIMQVGAGKYESLTEALSACSTGDTIKLLDDVTTSEPIAVNKDLTIDGGGHTIVSNVEKKGSVIKVTGNSDFTLKNITITGNDDKSGEAYGVTASTSGGSLSFENVTITDCFKAIYFANCSNTDITLTGCKLTSIYPFNVTGGTDITFSAADSSFNGWTSFDSAAEQFYFRNCSFGKGAGYATLKMYGNTTLTNCTFSKDYFAGLESGIASGTKVPIEVNFNSCSILDENNTANPLTAATLKQMFNYEIHSGSSEGDSTINNQVWKIDGERVYLTAL